MDASHEITRQTTLEAADFFYLLNENRVYFSGDDSGWNRFITSANLLRHAGINLDKHSESQAPGFVGTFTISEQDICHLLCSAWEGGSNYWAESDGTPYRFPGAKPAHLHLPVSVWDREENHQPYVLDRAAIERGVSLLARHPSLAISGSRTPRSLRA